jgi:hypothetical protein
MDFYYTVDAIEKTGLARALMSFRRGGVSQPPYHALNLADHVGDDPAAVKANREIFFNRIGWPESSFLYCRQVHSNQVVCVDASARRLSPPIAEADAMISTLQGLALGVFTADCASVFILDSETPAIGLVHAGWRGTLARIAEKTIAAMQQQFGTLPANCIVHLGPAIQRCCYTVSPSLAAEFEKAFGPHIRTDCRLDLQAANIQQLTQIGVPRRNISATQLCTACRTDLFYSHRAENGATGRMLSLIGLFQGAV